MHVVYVQIQLLIPYILMGVGIVMYFIFQMV